MESPIKYQKIESSANHSGRHNIDLIKFKKKSNDVLDSKAPNPNMLHSLSLRGPPMNDCHPR